MIDWSDYANFSEAEFVCRCGCGRADMEPTFMFRLQRIRDAYRIPMIVSSGFRCIDHDRRVRGAGVHPTGRAGDFQVSGRDCFKLLDLAISKGMTGIGLKQHGPHDARFMHLDDTSGVTRPWVWTYG